MRLTRDYVSLGYEASKLLQSRRFGTPKDIGFHEIIELKSWPRRNVTSNLEAVQCGHGRLTCDLGLPGWNLRMPILRNQEEHSGRFRAAQIANSSKVEIRRALGVRS